MSTGHCALQVVSARLYLPLSSLDSSDVDQPAYMLQYNGTTNITLPPYLQPTLQPQQQQRSKSPKLIGGGSSSSRSRSSSRPGSSSSSKQPGSSSSSAHLFDNVVQGNVSAQVNMQYCLSRAVFALAAPTAQQAALPAAATSSSSSEVPLTSETDSAGAPAAAAAATAADGMPGSGSSAAAAAAAARPKLKIFLLDADDLNGSLPPIAASSSSSSAIDDIGSAEVDVMQLLQESGVDLSRDQSSGDMSPAAAAAAASWEGWIKLDKVSSKGLEHGY